MRGGGEIEDYIEDIGENVSHANYGNETSIDTVEMSAAGLCDDERDNRRSGEFLGGRKRRRNAVRGGRRRKITKHNGKGIAEENVQRANRGANNDLSFASTPVTEMHLETFRKQTQGPQRGYGGYGYDRSLSSSLEESDPGFAQDSDLEENVLQTKHARGSGPSRRPVDAQGDNMDQTMQTSSDGEEDDLRQRQNHKNRPIGRPASKNGSNTFQARLRHGNRRTPGHQSRNANQSRDSRKRDGPRAQMAVSGSDHGNARTGRSGQVSDAGENMLQTRQSEGYDYEPEPDNPEKRRKGPMRRGTSSRGSRDGRSSRAKGLRQGRKTGPGNSPATSCGRNMSHAQQEEDHIPDANHYSGNSETGTDVILGVKGCAVVAKTILEPVRELMSVEMRRMHPKMKDMWRIVS